MTEPDWLALARTLARWLPQDGLVYARTNFRADMPAELLTGKMTPEDWMVLARTALERRTRDHQP